MILDLKKLFGGEDGTQGFDYTMSLSDIDFFGERPFVSPVVVKGEAKGHLGSITLRAQCEFDFSIACDRCAAQIAEHRVKEFSHTLVTGLQNEDNDDYVEVENNALDLDELLRADLLLDLPTKFLCNPECRGLCPSCGQNLNDGPCKCRSEKIDPRLEVFKQLIK